MLKVILQVGTDAYLLWCSTQYLLILSDRETSSTVLWFSTACWDLLHAQSEAHRSDMFLFLIWGTRYSVQFLCKTKYQSTALSLDWAWIKTRSPAVQNDSNWIIRIIIICHFCKVHFQRLTALLYALYMHIHTYSGVEGWGVGMGRAQGIL